MNIFELIPESISGALIGGLFAVIGAAVGGIISSKSSRSAARRAMLSDAYSRVIAEYVKYVTTEQSYPPTDLVAAIEIAWMLSSKRTGKILRNLESAVLQKDPNKEKCGVLLDEFRSAARKETGKQ